jgi:hypothetical protein
MSAGVDARLSGVNVCAFSNSLSVIGPDTAVTPGATAHTRTCGASASANIRVAASSAALDKVYEK